MTAANHPHFVIHTLYDYNAAQPFLTIEKFSCFGGVCDYILWGIGWQPQAKGLEGGQANGREPVWHPCPIIPKSGGPEAATRA
jgi:hypothetical protein